MKQVYILLATNQSNVNSRPNTRNWELNARFFIMKVADQDHFKKKNDKIQRR